MRRASSSTVLAGALLLAACGGSGGDGGGTPQGSGDGNDTFATAQAVSIGAPKAGVISSPSDQDWYSFTTPGAGQVTVTLDGLSADADLGLYNSSQLWLSGSSNTGTLSDTVTATAAGAASYRAVVLPAAPSASYTLTVTFTVAVGDGNDTYDTAQAIAIGTPVSSTIASATDPDWYRVTTTGAGTITVTLDGMTVGAEWSSTGCFRPCRSTGATSRARPSRP